MNTSFRRPRGRPVGTGIDDRERLARVRDLLLSGAASTPSSAIRMAGHDEPSVVRRLREKLKAVAG